MRIEGVDLPRNKRIVIGLTYLYGIGKITSERVLAKASVDESIRVKDLTEAQEVAIRDVVSSNKLLLEGELRREVQLNIKRLQEIGTYRGLRHRRNLPVRGQRTKTNARTRRGVKRTVPGRGRRRGMKKK